MGSPFLKNILYYVVVLFAILFLLATILHSHGAPWWLGGPNQLLVLLIQYLVDIWYIFDYWYEKVNEITMNMNISSKMGPPRMSS